MPVSRAIAPQSRALTQGLLAQGHADLQFRSGGQEQGLGVDGARDAEAQPSACEARWSPLPSPFCAL